MKAPCLTDLLNHTFPLTTVLRVQFLPALGLCSENYSLQSFLHYQQLSIFSQACQILWTCMASGDLIKPFRPVRRIFCLLKDLISSLNLAERCSPHERCSPSALQVLLFSSWKTVMTPRGILREQVTVNLIFCYRVGTLFSFTEKSL